MVVDIGEVKRHIKPKADSTLRNMRKEDLIEYIRCLENNYNVAVSFNNQQAKNCEKLLAKAVEVVRCKECRWAKPYERTDGKIGYYCHFCGHSFKYGTNWERLFTPIKESDDFCSYGERRTDGK